MADTDVDEQGIEDDNHREWFDGEHQTRGTADPDTEGLIDKIDSLPSDTRLAVIKAIHGEHDVNGRNFDAAVRTFHDYIDAAEPSEDVRGDNAPPTPKPASTPKLALPASTDSKVAAPKAPDSKATAFMPDAFPSIRRGDQQEK